MAKIENNYFRYRKKCRRIGTSDSNPTEINPTMKNNTTILAVTLGAIAAAAYLLSFAPISAESLVGYGSVLALVAVGALEYRLSWKNLFGK